MGCGNIHLYTQLVTC